MYHLSKDYDKLYELICQGHIAACFVDYDFYRDGEHLPVRDIARVRRFNEYDITVSVRGTQYGGVDLFMRKVEKSEKDLFVKDCQRMNLEWIDDSYWKNRCQLAEKCIEESPCDPDITTDQIKAHQDWEVFVNSSEV